MWLIVSMYLVLLMHDANLVTTLVTAISGLFLSFLGFLFVDDTDIIVLGQDDDTAVSVRAKLQRMVTHWNGILKVTGGALKQEKCYWYLADFVWNNRVWSYSTKVPDPILIRND